MNYNFPFSISHFFKEHCICCQFSNCFFILIILFVSLKMNFLLILVKILVSCFVGNSTFQTRTFFYILLSWSFAKIRNCFKDCTVTGKQFLFKLFNLLRLIPFIWTESHIFHTLRKTMLQLISYFSIWIDSMGLFL